MERLDNAAVASSNESILVDFYDEGGLLVVTFGAFDFVRPAEFDFFGRLKKLEGLSGRKINKILVRDPSKSWYHYGADGRGVPDTVERLRSMISGMRPGRVVALGQSMGAFGAVLFGALLGVDEVVAFGPMARFGTDVLHYTMDDRWGDLIARVESAPPAVFHRDLPRLIDSLDIRTKFYVYYGTKPTDLPDDMTRYVDAVNHDALHGFLYGQCPRVRAFPVRWSLHFVLGYLGQVGFTDELLLHRILGRPYLPETLEGLPIDPQWLSWMEVNYAAGFDVATILPQVRLSDVTTAEVAAAALDRARRNVLRRVL